MSDIDLESEEIKQAIKSAVQDATKGLEKKNKELLDKLVKSKDIDPNEYIRLREENDILNEKISELTKTSNQQTSELEKFKKEAENESAYSSKLLVETHLNDAITRIGIKPEFNRAVKALFSNQAQVIAEAEGRSVKIGDKSVDDFIKEWADSDEGKSFRSAPLNQGGGSTGGAGSGSKKTITRSEFRALDPQQRMDFSKSGGEITE